MDREQRIRKVYDKQRQNNQKGQVRNDVDKLKFYVNKSLERVGIGALDDMEKNFGHLWGHGENRDLTDQELEEREIWLEVRESILDRTHDAIRILTNKINDFEEHVNG